MITLPRQPTVAGFFGSQALGNFIMQNLAFAAACRDLGAGRRVALFHNDRPYKHLIVALNPALTERISLDPKQKETLPMEWLNSDQAPDLFLTPARLEIDRVSLPLPRLRFPDHMTAPLSEALKSLGVEPDRWFVCLHLRELGYRYRYGVDDRRSVDKSAYLLALDHVVREAGGQVVRIGDPSMEPMAKRFVDVDLAAVRDSFALQAFAVSRARFFLGVDSGPTQLASGFGVPTLSTNAHGVGCWRSHDRVLFKRFFRAATGQALSPKDLLAIMDSKLQILHLTQEIRAEERTADDILDAVKEMLNLTRGQTGWRDNWSDEAGDDADEQAPSLGFPGPIGALLRQKAFGIH